MNNNQKVIDELLKDFFQDNKKHTLYVFNSPSMTEKQVNDISAGKKLILLSQVDEYYAQKIWDNFIQQLSQENDIMKWMIVHYLAQIEKISGLSWELKDKYSENISNPHDLSYFDYYLVKHYKN